MELNLYLKLMVDAVEESVGLKMATAVGLKTVTTVVLACVIAALLECGVSESLIIAHLELQHQ